MSEQHYIKRAAALQYDRSNDVAPKLTAKGNGAIAETIIKKAKENNIPIQEDPSLVELLSKININEQIPEELYQVIAEIFAFIYQTDKLLEKTEN
ncbi:EscU/YscU/HrcU family type III secretion system export apparatus switch protein [Aquibacillus sediminis]|uniref:EscU/YscU/HrcU family type III secretion system export apparatus switch protein n=1 Tax=Aquibacillus sediminis TaxID=2574734 RepID=UPI0011090C90|nr:EscU/YscU/HrcU family type III secretion system export apparatus switch protein [Aquibacillus sediminis]